jgi:hypothetical protein
MGVFWDVAPCNLDAVDGISEVRTASIIRAMMEAVLTSETSVYSIETTRRYIREEFRPHIRRRENLKFHVTLFTSLLQHG